MCDGVCFCIVFLFYFFFSTLPVLCVFPSTRGSSDSIAPRDSLPPGIQEMKGSLIPFYMVQFMQPGRGGQEGESGVKS